MSKLCPLHFSELFFLFLRSRNIRTDRNCPSSTPSKPRPQALPEIAEESVVTEEKKGGNDTTNEEDLGTRSSVDSNLGFNNLVNSQLLLEAKYLNSKLNPTLP